MNRVLGRLSILLALAALMAFLLVQPEAHNEQFDVGSGSDAATRDIDAMPTFPMSPGSPAVHGRGTSIRAVPFRDNALRLNLRLLVRGITSEYGPTLYTPVGGARVSLEDGFGGKELAAVHSGADGAYAMDVGLTSHLRQDNLHVRVEKMGWISWQRSVQRLPSDPAASPTRRYNLQLYRPMEIAGIVIEAATGAPIAGAKILQVIPGGWAQFIRATTDATGAFAAHVADEPYGHLCAESAQHLGVQIEWTKAALTDSVVIRMPRHDDVPQ